MSNETANAAGYVSVFMCKIIVNPVCSMPKVFWKITEYSNLLSLNSSR